MDCIYLILTYFKLRDIHPIDMQYITLKGIKKDKILFCLSNRILYVIIGVKRCEVGCMQGKFFLKEGFYRVGFFDIL